MTTTTTEETALTKKDFATSNDVRWCPGCGDYAILNAVQRTLPELGIPREKFVVVSGIGCSSRFPYYMNTYGFHTIHGRAPTVATGVKVANPDLSVWMITGDGDGLSIGANHLLHLLRRNLNLNVLLFNNHAATGAGTLNFWAYMLNSEYSGEEYLFPDGYDQILANYAGDYSVSLQNVVTAINYGGDGVSVISTNGTSHFDAVIVTVPLGVLKAGSIQFTPALPASHQNAIAKLGFGTLDKIYLQFDDVFWNRDTHSLATPFTGLPPGHFNAWLNLYPVVNKPILVCFNGGPAALELASQPDEVIVEMARSTILQAYGLEP